MPEFTDNKWHLSKSVNLGHIVTTIMVLVGALSAYFSMDSRIALLEDDANDQQERIIRILERQSLTDARQDSNIEQLSEDINEYNDTIVSKLDMLLNNIGR